MHFIPNKYLVIVAEEISPSLKPPGNPRCSTEQGGWASFSTFTTTSDFSLGSWIGTEGRMNKLIGHKCAVKSKPHFISEWIAQSVYLQRPLYHCAYWLTIDLTCQILPFASRFLQVNVTHLWMSQRAETVGELFSHMCGHCVCHHFLSTACYTVVHKDYFLFQPTLFCNT